MNINMSAGKDKRKNIFEYVSKLNLSAQSEADGTRLAAIGNWLARGGLVDRESRPRSAWMAGVLVTLATEIKDGQIVDVWLEMVDQHKMTLEPPTTGGPDGTE